MNDRIASGSLCRFLAVLSRRICWLTFGYAAHLAGQQPQDWPHGSEWWFVPVPLAPGRHAVKIEGRANASRLDVRFGGPGSRRLDGAHFLHPNDY